MNDALIADLRKLTEEHDIVVTERADSVHLRLVRPPFAVSIVISRATAELGIEVHDWKGTRLIADWLDYAGYEATPEQQLAEEMRAEVIRFVERLLHRKLRLSADGRSLEWESAERWLQAIPFVPDV